MSNNQGFRFALEGLRLLFDFELLFDFDFEDVGDAEDCDAPPSSPFFSSSAFCFFSTSS